MIKLDKVTKTYRAGEIITAVKDLSFSARQNEFVTILGPSGCGKTTLLNIIGGLDKSDSGDLIVDGLSTKNFKDSDWDAYRNRSIGFVFQNYNLITHQSVLQNVEIALTLSGVSPSERKQRATQVLTDLGLADQLEKKPTQLSGGQMQRVAIARALVNNPDIILADEPTGSLDSSTSVQLMEILQQISKTRLVIMVTHNTELANRYSSRVIRMLDGEIQSDSNPVDETMDKNTSSYARKKYKKTSMSMTTAIGLSFKNLSTKRGRSIITAIAGSIGIISLAIVLALSSGVSTYMRQLQLDALSVFPITVTEELQTIQRGPGADIRNHPLLATSDGTGRFISDNILFRYDADAHAVEHKNVLTKEYFEYISNMQVALPNSTAAISYSYGVEFNLLARGEGHTVKFEPTIIPVGSSIAELIDSEYMDWRELPGDESFILSFYDLIGEGSRFPREANEIALVVDYRNKIDKSFFEKLGFFTATDEYKLTDFIGLSILKVIPNDSFYSMDTSGIFLPASASEYENLFMSSTGIELTITGILRIKEEAGTLVGYLTPGLVYTPALREIVLETASQSAIALAQRNSDIDVLTGAPFRNEEERRQRFLSLGIDTTPIGISIFPMDFNSKNRIKEYLDLFNIGRAKSDQIIYNDIAYQLDKGISTTVNLVSIILIAFAAIALIVSTIMIGITTYVSVIERTKEIGILRSVGARKTDVARVFFAETLIIGFTAGMFGICVAYLLEQPLSSIIAGIVNVSGLVKVNPFHAVALVAGSMVLTFIAGIIPSSHAARKDPVEALRVE